MNQCMKNGIMLTICIFLLSGCSGYDRVLFVTKTNVGLDIDDTPPTAEITIARRELAIAPTYQNTVSPKPGDEEKTLPLLGYFGLKGGVFDPGITSVFAGGDAAVMLVDADGKNLDDINSSICLTGDEKPDARSLIKRLWHGLWDIDPDETRTRPFYFATDTAFGVKVAWNGTGGPYPTSLKIGYNRFEFASPPIFIKDGCQKNNTEGTFEVKVPSFFTSLDNKSKFLEGPEDSGVTHVQFFATGKVAKEWAKRQNVRERTLKKMEPLEEEP